jgi:hypothetical protein
MALTTNPPANDTPTLEEVLTTWVPTGKAAKIAGTGERYTAHLAAQGRLRSVTTPFGRLIDPASCAAYAARRNKRQWRMPEAIAAKKEREEQARMEREHAESAP